jgi:ATP adenylyltransferase
MRQLWAPWRLEYIQTVDEEPGCFLCNAAASDDDERHLVVQRGERAFVVVNKFPYSSGHLLVAPLAHGLNFDDLDDATALEIHRLGAEGLEALRAVYNPDGFNLGWNIGRIAGAGVPDHGHLHVVPRWSGDTNFMPVLGDVKVMPEHLLQTREKLARSWPRRSAGSGHDGGGPWDAADAGPGRGRRRVARPDGEAGGGEAEETGGVELHDT